MSEEQPTNGELAVMIKGLREVVELRFDNNEKAHEAVNSHLTRLNGQVAKNTKFRTKWSGAYVAIAVVATLFSVLVGVKNIVF